MTTSIQALVDALEAILKEKECPIRDFDPEECFHKIFKIATQALADYHKSSLEPEVQSPDEATVATLRSSSPNSIEQEKKLRCGISVDGEVYFSFEIGGKIHLFVIDEYNDASLVYLGKEAGKYSTEHGAAYIIGRMFIGLFNQCPKCGRIEGKHFASCPLLNQGDVAGSQTNSIDKK